MGWRDIIAARRMELPVAGNTVASIVENKEDVT